MSRLIISKDGVCRNIVFGSPHPFELFRESYKLQFHSKSVLDLLRFGCSIGHGQLHTAVWSQLRLLLEEPQEPCAATV